MLTLLNLLTFKNDRHDMTSKLVMSNNLSRGGLSTIKNLLKASMSTDAVDFSFA